MEHDLRVHDVPAATLLAFLEATAVHSGQDIEAVSSFAGFSVSTARKALPTLESLVLVERDAEGHYTATRAYGVHRGMSEEEGLAVLRRALLGYRPFGALLEGLALGEPVGTASRKAGLLLGFGNGGAVSSKFDVLVRLGSTLGILNQDGSIAREYDADDDADAIVLTAEDVESEAKARLFIAKWLGRSVHNALDETDRQLLCDALLKYRIEPRKSVDAAGQALEDYLREIAGANALAAEAKKLNGAGQLANLLVNEGVLHSHHQKLADAVSTVRNATSHRKDKKTMKAWTITEHGAFSMFVCALTAIGAIGEYTTNGRQTI
jgi:hypothetical protein